MGESKLFERNVLIVDEKGFKGEWVAVPREDFDAVRVRDEGVPATCPDCGLDFYVGGIPEGAVEVEVRTMPLIRAPDEDVPVNYIELPHDFEPGTTVAVQVIRPPREDRCSCGEPVYDTVLGLCRKHTQEYDQMLDERNEALADRWYGYEEEREEE